MNYNTPTDRVLGLRYKRDLLASRLSAGVGFQVSKRSTYLRFDERKFTLNLDIVTEHQSGLSIGDFVLVYTALETPWQTEQVGKRRSFSNSSPTYIVAFVELTSKCGSGKATATFAVLSKEMNAVSNPHAFVMTGDEMEKIALFFVQSLEKTKPPRA